MRLLTNSLLIRSAAAFLCSVAAFAIGVVAIRMLRRGIVDEGEVQEGLSASESLPVQAYTVIQQLKQQKFALQNEQQIERRRSKTAELITASIIANLPVGMLFVGPNGLVRHANAAARRILGFASPMGMSVADILREAKTFSANGHEIKAKDVFTNALQDNLHGEDFECRYVSPNEDHRQLKITLIPVRAPEGTMLGLAAAVADHAEVVALREAQLLRAEESAELALEMRNSLVAIRAWAEQLKSMDSGRANNVAGDISAETARVEKALFQFVAGTEKTRGAHA